MTDSERYAMAEAFLRKLRSSRKWLSAQEIRTLKGQALSGDIEGAERGLARLLEERL